jgi:catechol 2,3-dioxygenase-like lactoylglutathione lyase family enzyme
MVKPKLSVVTLGVADVERSRRFYEALGWTLLPGEGDGSISFFALENVILAVFGATDLAADAGMAGVQAAPNFRGIALAHNEPSIAAVDQAYDAFLAAGASPQKPPEHTSWGGYSGYVADPDGHLWEIAFNPMADWT